MGKEGFPIDIVNILYTRQAEINVMGYRIKLQKVERPTNRSYYVNLPVVLAEAMGVQKGDELEWSLEDKNTLVLTRVRKEKARRLKSLT
jgi:antitoxin component of MazEF toxin-antitoxin module